MRTIALSLDPYLRNAMAGRHTSGAIKPGEVVRGEGLVEVLAGPNPGLWIKARATVRGLVVYDHWADSVVLL